MSVWVEKEIQALVRRGEGELSAVHAGKSAIEAAIQAGRRKIDLEFERGGTGVNG